MSTRQKEPLREKIWDVIVIGTGFSGICISIQLQKKGIKNFRILEKSNAVGGTWRDNTYPGAECDVQSHLYSFSFEPKPDWEKMYGRQKEILEYLNYCVDKYELRERIEWNTTVKSMHYSEELGLWKIMTLDGVIFHSKTVVSGNGGLSIPSIPEINGINNFRGKTFHSARWDHDYDLKNKRVAVIGTGASAIQIVPAITPLVKELHLFQRTPPWIIPKPDRVISDAEKFLFKNVPITQTFMRDWIYWNLEARAFLLVYNPWILKILEPIAKNFISSTISDPELQKKVTPGYTIGCKRVLLSNEYYPALNQKHVHVISSSIREVRENSILNSEGEEIEIDAIILATGFKIAEHGIPFEIIGKSKRNLQEQWLSQGAESYLGSSMEGFPNFFLMTGPNTGLGHSSMVYMIEAQAQYISQCIEFFLEKKLKSMEVKREVQENFNRELEEKLKKTVWAENCNSWYVNQTGKNSTLWPGYTFEFRFRSLVLNPGDYHLVSDGNEKKQYSLVDSILQIAKSHSR